MCLKKKMVKIVIIEEWGRERWREEEEEEKRRKRVPHRSNEIGTSGHT